MSKNKNPKNHLISLKLEEKPMSWKRYVYDHLTAIVS